MMDTSFVLGANVPWVDYGLDFGGNAWRPDGGVGRPDARQPLRRSFAAIAASGVRAVRWFLFCDGRAGIRFDAAGVPLGVDEFVFRDIDAALEVARRFEMSIMFVLLDFHWCHPGSELEGVQLGGRAPLLRDVAARRALMDRVLRPVLEQYRDEPSVFAWDVINEPEWIREPAVGLFVDEAVALARSSSARPVTLGSASAAWRSRYADVPLDFEQVHWYDGLKNVPRLDVPVDRLGFRRPVMLGEFPTRGSRLTPQQIIATARAAGYAGAFYWSALSGDACSNLSAMLEDGGGVEAASSRLPVQFARDGS